MGQRHTVVASIFELVANPYNVSARRCLYESMHKKMDLGSFDVYQYLKQNFPGKAEVPYILADHEMYKQASIRFPFRNFFYGIGMTYDEGGVFQVGSNEHQMKNGSLITIGPGIVSAWKQETSTPADTILFTEGLLANFLKNSFLASLSFFLPGGNHVILLNDADRERIKSLFTCIRQFKDDPDVVAGMTYGLLMLVIRIHETSSGQMKTRFSAREQLVRDFMSRVARQFLVHKDVAYYAGELNVTPKYLSEALLAETGRSAKAVIDDTVFLEAKSLLRQTSMTVQEICYHIGYSDASYFTKAFRSKESMTPLAYRRQ